MRVRFPLFAIAEVSRAYGVDAALIHYYFDTKRGLFDAVFLRRAELLNRYRLDAMNAYDRARAA